jgi:hypothetical protein
MGKNLHLEIIIEKSLKTKVCFKSQITKVSLSIIATDPIGNDSVKLPAIPRFRAKLNGPELQSILVSL